MRLQLTQTGHIAPEYPVTFFRVEDYMTGMRIADFTDRAETVRFAINDADQKHRRYDHRVVTLHRHTR